MILLPQPPECRDNKYETHHSASLSFWTSLFSSFADPQMEILPQDGSFQVHIIIWFCWLYVGFFFELMRFRWENGLESMLYWMETFGNVGMSWVYPTVAGIFGQRMIIIDWIYHLPLHTDITKNQNDIHVKSLETINVTYLEKKDFGGLIKLRILKHHADIYK
jgi:hypothetical protein